MLGRGVFLFWRKRDVIEGRVDLLTQRLCDGMRAMGLFPDADRVGRLLQFQKLLEKWNKVYNLSAINDPLEVIQLHLLDSLSVVRYLPGARVADVGTGAGLPGIPLAIECCDKFFYLIDCSSKKTRFVRQAVIELNLNNVEVIHGRAEEVKLGEKVDVVVTRAFSSLDDTHEKTKHLLKEEGLILALKGRFPEQELTPLSGKRYAVTALNIPGVNAERHLVSLAL